MNLNVMSNVCRFKHQDDSPLEWIPYNDIEIPMCKSCLINYAEYNVVESVCNGKKRELIPELGNNFNKCIDEYIINLKAKQC